jgi:hypothetical protein
LRSIVNEPERNSRSKWDAEAIQALEFDLERFEADSVETQNDGKFVVEEVVAKEMLREWWQIYLRRLLVEVICL